MRHRYVSIIVLFVFSFYLCSCQDQKSDTSKLNTAKVVFAVGEVQVLEQEKWAAAQQDMMLTEGHEIKTGNQSQCNILIGADSYISVKEKSHLVLASLFRDVSGMEKTALELKVGKSVLNPKKLLKGESFQVKTPTAIAAVRGTQFVVHSDTGGKMKVAVVEGKVELKRRVPALENIEEKVVERSEVLTTLKEKVEAETVVVDPNQSAFIDNQQALKENRVIEESIAKHVEEVKSIVEEEEKEAEAKTDKTKTEDATEVTEKIKDEEVQEKLEKLEVMKAESGVKAAEPSTIIVKDAVEKEDVTAVKDLNTVKEAEEKKQEEKEESKRAKLIINSADKKSQIFVNNLFAGTGSIILNNPEPGEDIKIEVRTPGYEDFITTVELEEKEEKTVNVILKEGARLNVITPVPYSRIQINGRTRGRGEISVQPGSGKTIKVTVTARGFKKYETELTLESGEQRELKIAMEKSKELSRVRWSIKVGSSVTIDPVYYKNMLILATADGEIVAMNRNGDRIWKTDLKRRIESTPVIENGIIYTVTNSGDFYALRAFNGKVKWKNKLLGSLLFGSSPIVRNKKIYLATTHGRLYAFDRSGKEIWHSDIENGIYSSPAYSKGMLYVGAEDSHIYALDSDDGDIEWKFRADSRLVSSSPVIDNENLYVGSYRGILYAIHARKGKLEWKYKTKDSIVAAPFVNKGKVYFGSNDGYVYCLNASGKLIWKYNTGDKVTTTPSILGNNILVTSGSEIRSLSANSGSVQWSHKFKHKIRTSAMVVGQEIYVGLGNGEVAAVRNSLKDIYQ